MYATIMLNIPLITHKFLLCGHTQNEGDAMHACIEKEKKNVLKVVQFMCLNNGYQ
jgi:hypothetical protein